MEAARELEAELERKMNYPTVESTIEFIKKAHAGQVDKCGVEYWRHPVAVMNNLPSDATEFEKKAALLHDILEDTDYTKQDLLDLGYSHTTLYMVELVTHDKNERTYMEQIQHIINSSHTGAIRIKIADIKHNMNPDRGLDQKLFDSLCERYRKALNLLMMHMCNGGKHG